MVHIAAIYGSPRRQGNTAKLMQEAVAGARSVGARVDEIVLRDLKMSPCMEIYGCKESGKCVIQDEYQQVQQTLMEVDALILASPIFFYTVSAHTKILMDRCQSLWVKKYWVDDPKPPGQKDQRRKGLFISVGATQGRKLFDGVMLTVRYFFDVLDAELWRALLYRGLDGPDDVLSHPDHLAEARTAGEALALAAMATART
ncbi:MAG: flavodoxin family protein [Desulfobacterales bacterium]|nr:flavodoxin family protein [Desulfobacterales bacterium]